MALADFLALGNAARGVYDARQQAIVNAQRQQQINDMMANDALRRQVQQQQYQDYLTGTAEAGRYYRNLAQGLQGQTPPPVASSVAPAPAPGQNSAQQSSPVAVPSAVPMPGATMQQAPLPPAAPVPTSQFQIAPGLQQERDKEAVRLMQQELVKQQSALPTAPPSQVPLIQGNIAALKRQISAMSARAGGGASSAPPTGPQDITQTAAQKSDVPGALPMGTYGHVLALAQSNQVINLAARAAAGLLKSNPNLSDRQLDLAMQNIYPTLAQQSKDALQLAGLSNTEMFKAVNVLLRRLSLQARYPGYAQGGSSPYTPQQLAGAADMLRNGQSIPTQMKPYIYQAYPDLAPEALAGKAKQAAATVTATAAPKADAAALLATATAPVKATSGALSQVTRTLASIEPAYNALETNFSYLLQTAKQYGLGPATPVNTLLNKLRSMGSPDATKFQLALQAVQKEYGKVLTASTGARGVPVAAMREANATLSPNMTLGQLEAAQQAMQTDGRNVLDSYRQQKTQLMGQLGSTPSSAPSQQFQQGAIYTDANGNKAQYDNGQWVPVK